MGYRTSWVAVKSEDRTAVLTEAGWVDSGERAEFMETGLYSVDLTNGWMVLAGSGWDFMDCLTLELAARVSKLGSALFLTQNDTTMDATIAGLEQGSQRWSVRYSGTDGVSKPEVEGPVPAVLASVVAACVSEQSQAGGKDADVDYMYEIVPELGRSLIGFRHDQIPEHPDEEPFHVMRLL